MTRVTLQPTPVAVWAASVGTPTPAGTAAPQAAPTALPGVTVTGGDLQAVDVKQLLRQDPQTEPGERTALSGCTGCQLLPSQYRDLVGDGGAELITAVVTADHHAYLHVYQLRGQQVFAVLTLSVLPGFTADTLGTDLVVHEPTSSATRTTSTYHWNGAQLVRTTATGPDTTPAPGPNDCPAPTPYPGGKFQLPLVIPSPSATAGSKAHPSAGPVAPATAPAPTAPAPTAPTAAAVVPTPAPNGPESTS
ncbi:hypothetical protein OG455_24005 [Kitasatospora sp. NBC_01287]|uniref:hypothetical protein n=1 Tax=Kitasatospora sp. NBC_01287 TaxID=2903573 RepID=UPI00225C12C5|nr:hypothetical protein [Kitasatospora sp. NBC_01287]MCX4748543.1 hypothetical protein [Kitasatospora sp. NBC_01287]